MVEEAILLRCLTPGEAAVLIRPAIRDNAATIVARPEQAPRVITIRATAEQLQSVRAILDKYEGAGASCASRPTPPVTP